MSVTGTWNIAMKSPFGDQAFDIIFQEDPPSGALSQGGTEMAIENLVIDGDSASFTTDVTTPMKMSITWTLQADGDVIAGQAKAGFFPAQKVNGTRA